MENTLEKSSGILVLKSKFFLIRVLTYFGFLLIPVWAQKYLELNQGFQAFVMGLYLLFICSQWFFLGKEIDHRLKVYFRVNSSMDRVVYRLFLGMFFFILYFNLLAFLKPKWIYNSFWITWVILGLFYSWPTRGKIIKESVTSNFGEFRFLDSFEKTLVSLTLIMFIFTIPEMPNLTNFEALKLYFDPHDKVSPHYWEFLKVNYYPFFKYPKLFRVGWAMHFYCVGIGFFLLAFYALLRFFVSRRLSLLGVFAILSSWSVTKILAADFGAALYSTYSLLWIWSILWVTKSSTYRAGLFLGLVGYFGTLINQSFIALLILVITLLYFVFLKEKTSWFKKQLIRYCLLGVGLNIIVLFTHTDIFTSFLTVNHSYWEMVQRLFNRKAFFSLSFFGFFILLFKMIKPSGGFVVNYKIEEDRIKQILLGITVLFLYGLIFDVSLISYFSLMWVFAFFSLIPLELIFQNISRLRSSRNMIYLIYILICLLDSHFEGRVKVFLRLFNS